MPRHRSPAMGQYRRCRESTPRSSACWNEERGFGFVRSACGDVEVFVHIAAFPRDGVRPRLGELISFDLEKDVEGRLCAVRVMRPGRAPTTPARRAAADAPSGSAFGRVLAVLLVIGIGACAYLLIAPRFAATPTRTPSVAVPKTSSAATAPTSIAPATPTATAQAIPAAAAPA
ncbi:cold shock domain-containing protein [Xanthomonas translucens]|uniref:cold shock domain-containing protein n=2 Tax=Xanthomonas campestris pv. translucens TaxID=343 RepID=UPI0028E0A290|nr:cold shock domain-containing protein [Xanthomonas translucens]